MSDAPSPLRIPRGKPSILVLLYAALGVVSLGTYVAASAFGWGSGSEQRDTEHRKGDGR